MAAARKSRLAPPTTLTRADFRRDATPIDVSLGATKVGTAVPRENTTGSLGWLMVTRMKIKIGGVYVWVQANTTLTVVGSKDIPKS